MICCLWEGGDALVPTGYLLWDHQSVRDRIVKRGFWLWTRKTNKSSSFSFPSTHRHLSVTLVAGTFRPWGFNLCFISYVSSENFIPVSCVHLGLNNYLNTHTALISAQTSGNMLLSLWGNVQSMSDIWATPSSLSLHIPQQNYMRKKHCRTHLINQNDYFHTK